MRRETLGLRPPPDLSAGGAGVARGGAPAVRGAAPLSRGGLRGFRQHHGAPGFHCAFAPRLAPCLAVTGKSDGRESEWALFTDEDGAVLAYDGRDEGIRQLPEGIEQFIGDYRSEQLSSTLAFQLNLARLYLRDAAITLVDEFPPAVLNSGPAGCSRSTSCGAKGTGRWSSSPTARTTCGTPTCWSTWGRWPRHGRQARRTADHAQGGLGHAFRRAAGMRRRRFRPSLFDRRARSMAHRHKGTACVIPVPAGSGSRLCRPSLRPLCGAAGQAAPYNRSMVAARLRRQAGGRMPKRASILRQSRAE